MIASAREVSFMKIPFIIASNRLRLPGVPGMRLG